jgi:hypothetical protein
MIIKILEFICAWVFYPVLGLIAGWNLSKARGLEKENAFMKELLKRIHSDDG